jgi:hypothetical protein
MEQQSPGSKAAFYLNFIERMAPLLAGHATVEREAVHPCPECGAPTSGDVCAFCRLVATASAHEPVPVSMMSSKGRR